MKNLKKVFVLVLILVFSIHVYSQWTQLGNDIIGLSDYDKTGNSIDLSYDGSIMAVGHYQNSDSGSYAGQVKVFELISGSWIQIGSSICGENSGDESGYSVSISDDGSIVAIGAHFNDGNGNNAGQVRIFEYNGGDWIQIGSDIDGEAASDEFGHSVCLNSSGTIVVIGGWKNDGNLSNSGHARIFEYNGGDWIQLGNDIDGEHSSDSFGTSVSIDSTGTIVAIGAYNNDDGGSSTGHVRVFEYNAGNWVQMGNDIDGELPEEESGSSVDINSYGTIVAIGAYKNDGTAQRAGTARVYEYNGSNWIQLGTDIDGDSSYDWFGWSVDMSSSGNRLAIGAINDDNNGNNSGTVKVYEYSGGNWQQVYSDINGETSGELSGYSVSLNANGTIVAVGAPLNYEYGTYWGQARAYSLTTSTSETLISSDFLLYPNPTDQYISIDATDFLLVEIFDNLGNKVLESKTNKNIDLNKLPNGLFYINMIFIDRVITQKLVKQ